MSSAFYQFVKEGWEKDPEILKTIFPILAASSILGWIRTLFLMPLGQADEKRYLWNQSPIGSLLTCTSQKKLENELELEDESEESEINLTSLKPILKSLNTWQFTFFTCVINSRVDTIQGRD